MSIIDHTLNALLLVMWLSLPAVVAATAVGLLVGLFQALTQIQDQTLPAGLKLVAVVITLIATGFVLGSSLMRFTIAAFDGVTRF